MKNRVVKYVGAAAFLALLALIVPLTSHAAAPDLSYADFAKIPVLHEGRIKPLDSLDRITLSHLSIEDGTPAAWLARALFAPSEAMQERVFKMATPALVQMLYLPPRADGLYSFHEIAAIFATRPALMSALLAKDKKTLSPEEKQLLQLYEKVDAVAQIMGTFSLMVTLDGLDAATRKQLHLPESSDVTYLGLVKMRAEIDAQVAATAKRKGDRIDSYSTSEQQLAELSYRLSVMEALGSRNALMRVIPPSWEGSEEWLTPWMVLEKGAGSPQSAHLFSLWQTLGESYRAGDAAQWKNISAQILAISLARPEARSWALSLEMAYNAVNPLKLSLFAYAAGLAALVAAFLRPQPLIAQGARMVLMLGALVHAMGIAARMAILMRPPVGTLYESMIFVSLVAVAFGLWLSRREARSDALFMGGLIALLLLGASTFFAEGADTFGVLVAVLNTNFWLATHVVCITTGYGSSLTAGMLAHLYLFKRAARLADAHSLAILQRRLHRVALVALFFTAVGTMLGGIWADQSWGRFWGWDPKENGALWIVLWLIWLVHGRIAGQFSELGFAACMALINIVVALAWVGVNLLSVGLHSYGFTDAAANGLMGFCAAEFLLVGAMTATILLRGRSTASA